MKLLAVETSSNACSVALQIEGKLLERHIVEAKAHTRALLPMITGLLTEAKLTLADLDALALGNGPGSFIGMRIGASVVQGLAFSAGLNIIPVSSLAAIADEVFTQHDNSHVAVAQDARMNQVYLGCFSRDDSNMPLLLGTEEIHEIGEIETLRMVPDVAWLCAGAGWQRYPELASLQDGELTLVPDTEFPRARHLLGIATSKLNAGEAIPPEQLQPAYLRTQVAIPPKPARA